SFNVSTISSSLSPSLTSSINLSIFSSLLSLFSVCFFISVFLSDKSLLLNIFSLTHILFSSPINSIPPLQNQTSLQHFLPPHRDLQQIYDNFQYSHFPFLHYCLVYQYSLPYLHVLTIQILHSHGYI